MKIQPLFFGIILLALSLSAPLMAKEKIGWVENVRLYPGGFELKAKIDTGAKTSSINCDCVNPYEKDGEQWVKFSVTDNNGNLHWLDRKIVRKVKIKRHYGESQGRYVIKLGMCLAGVYKETEFSLIDRSGFNYQLLVGRQFLEGSHIVDPELKFTSKATCKDISSNE